MHSAVTKTPGYIGSGDADVFSATYNDARINMTLAKDSKMTQTLSNFKGALKERYMNLSIRKFENSCCQKLKIKIIEIPDMDFFKDENSHKQKGCN